MKALFLAMILVPFPLLAHDIVVQWDAPVGGLAVPQGYLLQYSTDAALLAPVKLDVGLNLTGKLTLNEGTYYIYATAYIYPVVVEDSPSSGQAENVGPLLESGPSNVKKVTIRSQRPGNPTKERIGPVTLVWLPSDGDRLTVQADSTTKH